MSPRRAALVTGAARRIGRALAVCAAEAGYDVAIHYGRSQGEAAEAVEAVEGQGRRAVLLDADLRDPAATLALVDRAAEALGPLSLLVNNASAFVEDRIETVSGQTWNLHLDTNLRAPVLLAQRFAAQAPDGSLIVNLLDQRVWKPNPQFFSYSLSKAGLWWATRTLAQALAPKIRVNGIGPGPTLPSVHQSEVEFAAEARNTLLQRRATPEEICAAMRYLIDAPSVTGQMIAVDGGQHLAWRTPDLA